MVVLFSHGVLAEYISTSLKMIGIATAISLVVGVPIGFAVGANRYAARSTRRLSCDICKVCLASPGCRW